MKEFSIVQELEDQANNIASIWGYNFVNYMPCQYFLFCGTEKYADSEVIDLIMNLGFTFLDFYENSVNRTRCYYVLFTLNKN